jgi:predicted RNA methylase
VLDVGCGPGYLAEYLTVQKACTVVGVEQDPRLAEIARRVCTRVQEVNLETEELRKIQGKFTAIFFGDVIEHVRNAPELLRQASELSVNGRHIARDVCSVTNAQCLTTTARWNDAFPISNRTLKRRRANDSADYLCESRSSSGTYKGKRPTLRGSFCIGATCRAAALHESALTGLIVRRRSSGWDVQMRPNALALGLLALQASAVNTLGEGTCRRAMMGHLQAGGLRATVSIQ